MKLGRKEIEERLKKHLPEGTEELASHWVFKYRFKLKISRSRKSKLGDYRPPFNGQELHQISVNGDLNPYSFLITLSHEVAHLIVWDKFQAKAKAHGAEWKREFKEILLPLVDRKVFPEDLSEALNNYLKNPGASSHSDPQLIRVLRKYDDTQEHPMLEEIPENSLFSPRTDKRVFQKKEKRRKRYVCLELKSGRNYLVSGTAEVELIEE